MIICLLTAVFPSSTNQSDTQVYEIRREYGSKQVRVYRLTEEGKPVSMGNHDSVEAFIKDSIIAVGGRVASRFDA